METDTYKILALKQGMKLYHRTGIRPNSAWTLARMLTATTDITGKAYPARRSALPDAIADLERKLGEKMEP